MPIEVDANIEVFDEVEFHQLAEKVIGIAFEVQNDFGRLMEKPTYQRVLQSRFRAKGMSTVKREVGITVTHGSFAKSYFMDLLLANGLMVETKTVERLTESHRKQSIHYLMLAGMHHGLLLNFRAGRVEKEFVSTQLSPERRRHFDLHETEFTAVSDAMTRCRALLVELLGDWGAFLETSLYREAVVRFFGGPEEALRRIPIRDGALIVGSQEVCLLDDHTAFAITALKREQAAMREHLSRFLKHTDLKQVLWFNMNHHDMTLVTIGR